MLITRPPFDATPAAVPGPRAVCFIYHAFNASLLATLLRNLEAQLQAGLQHVFLVYCNPVHGGGVIDGSRHFARWSAKSGAGTPILVEGRGWNARLGPVT